MPSWQGKSKGTTLGYRIFVAILKHAGIFSAYFLLKFVAAYYFLFSWTSSKPIYHLYRKRLHYGRVASLLRLYTNYYKFGQTLIDRVVVMSGIPNRVTFDFEGEENLHKIVAGKRGGLLLSAHVGNWEIAGHLLKRVAARINIVMFDGEHKQIKTYLESVTGERNVHIIVIRNDLSHIYEISEALKNNELVCMHADRYLEGNKLLHANLLGSPAKFPMGPFVLASKLDVPISIVFAMKDTSLHYHFSSTEPKTYEKGRNSGSMQQMLNDFVIALEEKVHRYPEQWYNYFDFWK